MKKRLISFTLVFALAFTAAACGEQKAPEKEPATEPVMEAEIEEVVEEPEPVEPVEEAPVSDVPPAGMVLNNLNGMWVAEDTAKLRPFACMIENGEGDLPFWGVSKAEIVYEAPAEADITRCMAVFQDWPSVERIGTVRSARTYYGAWSKEYDALFGHFGCSLFAVPMLRTIDDMDGIAVDMGTETDEAKEKQSPYLEDTMFFRDPNRASVHSVYTSGELIEKTLEKYSDHYRKYTKDSIGPRFDFVSQSESVDLSGDPNVRDCKVMVPGGFSDKKPYYVYDEASKTYLRYQKGTAHMDEHYNVQLAAKNLIVQNVDWEMYSGIDANYDAHNYKNIHTTGQGDGWFITEGKAIPIAWSKSGEATEGQPTIFLDMNGNGIKLNPGTTWISVVLDENKEKTGIYESEAEFQSAN